MTKTRAKPSAADKKAIQAIRDVALSLPEAYEDHPWGESAFKVKGKVFVFAGVGESGAGMSVKLTDSHAATMKLPIASPTGYGLGKSGWVSLKLGKPVAAAQLRAWITESYFNIAPKSVLKELKVSAKATKSADQQKSAKSKKPARKTAL
jgi:predicted DNA-binding protein (MmcQ/YjbR family)